MRGIYCGLMVAAITAMVAPSTWAQITNGDFEDGGTGWEVEEPANWTVSFPSSGGLPGGYARVQSPFGDSAGTGGIIQVAECGVQDEGNVCRITFDFKLDQIDASDETATIAIVVGGEALWVSEPGQSTPWTSITVTPPCGTFTLSLGLQVSDGNHGWAACFDNVTAVCEPGVAVPPSTWSEIKSLYGR